MSSLANSLQQQFPTKTIQPYGKVLVIPSKLYENEWEAQLEAEGYKTFSQTWNGELSVFIPIEKSGTIEKTNSKFRKRWTLEEANKLKEFFDMGLGPSEIAHKLDRTRGSILGKMQRLELQRFTTTPAQSTDTSELSITIGDDVVKEFLACVSELYPRYRHVCAFLLKEASNTILGEKQNES